ncbi:MAG: DUF4358 domain-containing protein [Eubacteriales bacterium]|jgi:hypothetical protein
MLYTKKLLAVLLALTLLVSASLTACGGKDEDAETSTSVSDSLTTPSDDPAEESEEADPSDSEEEADPSTSQPESSDQPEESVSPSKEPSTSAKPSAKPSTSAKPSVKPSQPAPSPSPSPSPSPAPSQPAPSEPQAPAGPTSADIMAKVDASYEMPMPQLLDDSSLSSIYGLDLSLVEDHCVKVPMMNVKANEIAIIRVKNASDVATVKSVLESRKATIVKQFEQYLQDQLDIAKNGIIGSSGNYVYMVIHEDASAIVDIIKANA